MEEDQEQKMNHNQHNHHVCKFCKKTFPCGRSLGGHMRSHMRTAGLKEKNMKKKQSCSVFNGGSSSNNANTDFEAAGATGVGGGGSGSGGGGGGCYTLRENPKKTWRISDSIDGGKQEKICKECGKRFQSWKVLFGHMRSHSEKESERVFSDSLEGEEEELWIDGHQKLVLDSHSDNETPAPKRKRRSRRMRYKNTNGTTTTTTIVSTTATSSSFSFANGSTSVSEIEQEQEEVAICLMMLSRDVGYWGGLNSAVESSDNNSVLLEVRSSCLVKQIAEKEDCNADQIMTVKKVRDSVLKSGVSESDTVRFGRKQFELGNSSFGVLRNGLKKVESEVSADGLIGADKFANPNEVGFELGRGSFSKSSPFKCVGAEMGKDLSKEVDDQANSECGKRNSSKKSKCDIEMGGESSKKRRYDGLDWEFGKDSPNKSKYECTTCNKTFHSYQALGGHRASHKKVKGCFASKVESSENSIETDATLLATPDTKLIKSCSPDSKLVKSSIKGSPNGTTEISSPPKKSTHECPICFKVFASGQALGGHKRSHVIEGSEARSSQAIVIHRKLPEIRDLLDLNLPAPIEDDNPNSNACIGFKPWWVGTNHKHEPPVGLISN